MKDATGAITIKGSAPFLTPNSAVRGILMVVAVVIVLERPVPVAAIRTAGAGFKPLGFVMSNLNVYLVPAVSGELTVNVRVPLANVFEFPNFVWPSSPASTSVTEVPVTATAFVSPVIVTLTLAASCMPETSVTVIVLVAPGYGLF